MARMTALGQVAADRREDILAHSLRLFAEKGFNGTSIADIARAVGVTKATLYHYFPSKADILETFLAGKGDGTALISTIMQLPQPLSERLTLIAKTYLDHFCKEPDLGLIFLRESLGNAGHFGTEKVKRQFLDRYYGRINALAAHLADEDELAGESEQGIRQLAESLIDALTLFWIRRRLIESDRTTEEERERYAQSLVYWLMGSRRLIVPAVAPQG